MSFIGFFAPSWFLALHSKTHREILLYPASLESDQLSHYFVIMPSGSGFLALNTSPKASRTSPPLKFLWGKHDYGMSALWHLTAPLYPDWLSGSGVICNAYNLSPIFLTARNYALGSVVEIHLTPHNELLSGSYRFRRKAG